jgi:hypothetical protein
MKANKVFIGGTYEARIAQNLHAKVLVVRRLPEEEAAPLRRLDEGRQRRSNKAWYECQLAERVGTRPKGQVVVVSALSIKRLIHAPNGTQAPQAPIYATTGNATTGNVATTPALLAGQPPEVLDRVVMGVPLAKAVKPSGKTVVATFRVVVPVEDLTTVFALLDEAGYRPSLNVVAGEA